MIARAIQSLSFSTGGDVGALEEVMATWMGGGVERTLRKLSAKCAPALPPPCAAAVLLMTCPRRGGLCGSLSFKLVQHGCVL